MLNQLNRKTIVFAVLCIVVILTNPTQNDFKHFLEAKNIKSQGGRTGYFLFFSIYEYEYSYSHPNSDGYIEMGSPKHYKQGKYIGVFKNFIEI